MKLNVGCGKKYREEWTNIDISPNVGADIVMDIEKPWQFADDSVDEIYCYHVLEHVKEYLFVIEEMYRVSKPDAYWFIGVPYISSSIYNAVNPYHHTHFNEYSFDFFDSNKLKGSANEDSKVELRVKGINFHYHEGWQEKNREEKHYARKHYWNVVRKLDFEIRVVK